MLKNRKNGNYITDRRRFRSQLKKILDFRPGNISMYEVAFIHRSASFNLPDGKRINNERLEYLGDAVLDAMLSDYLFEKFPDASEGFLAKYEHVL